MIEIVASLLAGFAVLFLPGFAITSVFFDKKELDVIEKAALSFALSIAVVPLLLFYMSWGLGVGINAANVAIAVLLIFLFCSLVYFNRKKDYLKLPFLKT